MNIHERVFLSPGKSPGSITAGRVVRARVGARQLPTFVAVAPYVPLSCEGSGFSASPLVFGVSLL